MEKQNQNNKTKEILGLFNALGKENQETILLMAKTALVSQENQKKETNQERV